MIKLDHEHTIFKHSAEKRAEIYLDIVDTIFEAFLENKPIPFICGQLYKISTGKDWHSFVTAQDVDNQYEFVLNEFPEFYECGPYDNYSHCGPWFMHSLEKGFFPVTDLMESNPEILTREELAMTRIHILLFAHEKALDNVK